IRKLRKNVKPPEICLNSTYKQTYTSVKYRSKSSAKFNRSYEDGCREMLKKHIFNALTGDDKKMAKLLTSCHLG
uniref:Uncharacterized protein n=1 Tax=Romanomermis culicivorax TaxID=13658 RepID=A0A915HR81_ROMCU